ncbi:MAG: hypothetical protein OEX02_20580 [Cyclobacteriaceae bacterium]|nr:hypothetical protein [Cyclobacteriaceae bacterium]
MKINNLNDIAKKEFFTVPENYFDELPQSLQKKTGTGVVNTFTSSAFIFIRYSLVILLFAVSIWWLLPKNGNPEPSGSMEFTEDVSVVAVVDFLNNDGMSTVDILEATFTEQQLIEFLSENGYEEENYLDQELYDELEWMGEEGLEAFDGI